MSTEVEITTDYEKEKYKEKFDLTEIPASDSKLVLSCARNTVINSRELLSGFEQLVYLLRIGIYCASSAPGYHKIEAKVREVGDTVLTLCGDTCLVVKHFEAASESALQTILIGYEYLLDLCEEEALLSFSKVSAVAERMTAIAEKLQRDVKTVKEMVSKTRGDTMARRDELGVFNQKFQADQQALNSATSKVRMVDERIDAIKENEMNAQATYRELGIFGFVKEVLTGNHKRVMQNAHEEKLRELEIRKKLIDKELECQQKIAEYTQILQDEDGSKEEKMIVSLKLTEQGLQRIMSIMESTRLFWAQMSYDCKNLCELSVTEKIALQGNKNNEAKKKFYQSKPFKKEGVTMSAKWVALTSECKVIGADMCNKRANLKEMLEDHLYKADAKRQFYLDLEEMSKSARENIISIRAKKEQTDLEITAKTNQK
ncbi:hypothetical protein BC937DRAFT_94595 [Endogone sp. FLAS-F59071]|nr:hypothetical protein BC937DRAFT_94595 [Endogone sp. FLAS-F59071]|eukprot:RUS20687.1 hypothetical protein BC937DRAFT_94595 [Endogone sp. FLAS-F59071]